MTAIRRPMTRPSRSQTARLPARIGALLSALLLATSLHATPLLQLAPEPRPVTATSLPPGSVPRSESSELDEAYRYRRTLAFPQAFLALAHHFRTRGFSGRAADCLVDTVLASGDLESGQEVAQLLPAPMREVVSAQLTAATTDDGWSRPLRQLLARPLPATGSPSLEAYEHLAAVTRRLLGTEDQGRALALLAGAKHQAGADCRRELEQLGRGPASWRSTLARHLAVADPLEARDGNYRWLLGRLSTSGGHDSLDAVEKRVAARQVKEGASASAAAMLLRAERNDLAGANLSGRRATAALLGEPVTADWMTRGIRLVASQQSLGLTTESATLAGQLEERWLAARGPVLSRPAAAGTTEQASAVWARLGRLALVCRRDRRVLECLSRALASAGGPTPAAELAASAAAVPGLRREAVALLDGAASRGAAVASTAALILARWGPSDEALTRYRRLVTQPGSARDALAAAHLEARCGRPTAALELLAAGLRSTPGDPELLDEYVRIAAGVQPDDVTLERLLEVHRAPPPRAAAEAHLLKTLDALAAGPAARSRLSTAWEAWSTCPGADTPELRAARAEGELARGRTAQAIVLARDSLSNPPSDIYWVSKLLRVLSVSSPATFPVTAARQLIPHGREGWGALYLEWARWLKRAGQADRALHAGLLALDQTPTSPQVCAELAGLVRRHASPAYLMGAYYLRTNGNPVYSAFQARYHAAARDFSMAQSYYRTALKAHPADTSLPAEYARMLHERGDDPRAILVYQLMGERMDWQYDRSWGPALVRAALARRDDRLFLDLFARWLLQPAALDKGILKAFLRLAGEAALLEQAATALENAVEQAPWLVHLYEGLALVRRRLGRTDAAAAAEQAMEAAARSPDAVLAGVGLE